MRTDTRSRSSFTRSGSVTYDLPNPASVSKIVTITLPPASTWTSGLHWHETHTEYLQIIQGSAEITLSNTTQIYTSSSGIITVPRYARHEWKRALSDGPDLIVQEWTDPEDGLKEVFFRNLSSTIEDSTKPNKPVKEWWLTWQLFIIFWGLDNWPVLFSTHNLPFLGRVLEVLGLGRRFEWVVTHFVLRVAVVLGGLLGLRSWYAEYMPEGRICSVHELEGELKR